MGTGFFQGLLCVRKHEDAALVEDRGVCAVAPLLDGSAARAGEHGCTRLDRRGALQHAAFSRPRSPSPQLGNNF